MDENTINIAIESISNRLLDKGFNINGDWLGYYDEYALHFEPHKYQDYEGNTVESEWGDLEIHSKIKVFNPYLYVGGDGYEYEKLSELSISVDLWKEVKKVIRNGTYGNYKIDGKKVCFDNPYPAQRVEFYQGSDVSINGYYE